MLVELPGFETTEVLYTGVDVVALRARDVSADTDVILKVAKAHRPSVATVARMEREWAIASTLPSPPAVRCLRLTQVGNRPVLVFEDTQGRSLAESLKDGQPVALETALRIALGLTRALHAVHLADVIHKDVRPANIVIGDHPEDVLLIDFGIAERVSRDGSGSRQVTGLHGTPAYMSPEQTGRMNRGIDVRSDLYSTGVTLYQMLTGRLPFDDASTLEVIHSHLARAPTPLRAIRPELPAVVEDMVLHLLQKNRDERYQSAAALEADLLTCLERLTDGTIAPFELGQHTLSDRFILSQRLYGRDAERARLATSLTDAAAGGRALWVVAGRAGIGKSALVQELARSFHKGHFVTGKFTLGGRGRPYSALVDAFEQLARHLMALPDSELAAWRAEALGALGSNAGIITTNLPFFEPILGVQPAVPALDRAEARNRFHFVVQAFVRSFCRPDAPLVVFLDDLQWADQATVQLVESLLHEDGAQHLLVIAAVRDHEISLAHPFSRALRRLEDADVPIHRVDLGPLDLASVTQLIVDTLSCSADRAAPLARLVMAKTLGNPFFVNQFLSHLRNRGALHFDARRVQWQWDEAGIEALEITDNVVELMTDTLLELDPEVQRTVRLAACIGARFDPETLAAVADRDEASVAAMLDTAAVAGLLVVLDGEGGSDSAAGLSFRFLHDRVHQAAYELIPEAERAQVHLDIGRRLQARGDAGDFFAMLEHLQAGQMLITDRADRAALIRLHAEAAQRTVDTLAFEAALEHVDQALSLVTGDLWADDHDLALALHTHGATAAVMSGEAQRMQAFCDVIFRRAATIFDKLPAYNILIDHHFSGSDQVSRALEIAFDALDELGMKFPRNPTPVHVAIALGRVKLGLRKHTPTTLAARPGLDDRRIQAILRLLVSLDGVAYMANPNAFALFVLTSVRLSLRHGHVSASGWGYNLYGAILCAALDDIAGGLEIATFGLQLAKDHDDTWMQTRIDTPYHVTIAHWTVPMQAICAPLEAGIERAMALGAYNPAGANLMYLAFTRFFAGTPLAELQEEQTEQRRLAVAIDQSIAVDFIDLFHDLCTDLADPEGVARSAELGADPLARFTAGGNKNGVFAVHLVRAIHAFLLGHTAEALAHSDRSAEEEASAAGTILGIAAVFWRALIVAAASDLLPRRRVRRELRKRAAKLRRWQTFCTENMEHKADLVEAELARVEGRHADAARLYDVAYRHAMEHGFLHLAAIVAERVGKWHDASDARSTAELWHADAIFAFQRWGAGRVVERLRHAKRTPALLEGTATHRVTMDEDSDEGLDLETLLRSSQAVLREMDLALLLQRVMHATMENAGAERGALAVMVDGELRIEARHPPELELGTGLVDGAGLCAAVVQLVRRSRQPVVLDDASKDAMFGRDAYIQAEGVRSVLCLPLVNQTELVAVLYLENNLTPGAFTPQRIQLLPLLCAQAAISIRNARLYAEQVALTQAYSRFVPRAFLEQLGRDSIVGVGLGDQVEMDMAILFADIRSFTTLSERLSPVENFAFLNEFLGHVSPIIREHHGFIDKYIGDAVMALFPGGADDAAAAAVAMQRAVETLNTARQARGEDPISIGIGLHIGRLMLGIIGEPERLDGTVISDAVNLASRIEGLTKEYQTSALISGAMQEALTPGVFGLRHLGEVSIRGKRTTSAIYELLDAEPAPRRAVKVRNRQGLEAAVTALAKGQWQQAEQVLATLDPMDVSLPALRARCAQLRDRSDPPAVE